MTGRQTCTCGAQVVEVRIDGVRYLIDWPWSPTGDVAVILTVAGAWQARYVPVGERLHGGEKRYRRHLCGDPLPDLSEPQRAAEPLRGEAFAAAVRKVQAGQARAERNRRGRRPGKAAVAIEKPGMFVKPPPRGANG